MRIAYGGNSHESTVLALRRSGRGAALSCGVLGEQWGQFSKKILRLRTLRAVGRSLWLMTIQAVGKLVFPRASGARDRRFESDLSDWDRLPSRNTSRFGGGRGFESRHLVDRDVAQLVRAPLLFWLPLRRSLFPPCLSRNHGEQETVSIAVRWAAQD